MGFLLLVCHNVCKSYWFVVLCTKLLGSRRLLQKSRATMISKGSYYSPTHAYSKRFRFNRNCKTSVQSIIIPPHSTLLIYVQNPKTYAEPSSSATASPLCRRKKPTIFRGRMGLRGCVAGPGLVYCSKSHIEHGAQTPPRNPKLLAKAKACNCTPGGRRRGLNVPNEVGRTCRLRQEA